MSVALKYFVSDVFHIFKNETDPVLLWLVHPWQWPMSRPLDILAQSGGWDSPGGKRAGCKDGLFSLLHNCSYHQQNPPLANIQNNWWTTFDHKDILHIISPSCSKLLKEYDIAI